MNVKDTLGACVDTFAAGYYCVRSTECGCAVGTSCDTTYVVEHCCHRLDVELQRCQPEHGLLLDPMESFHATQ